MEGLCRREKAAVPGGIVKFEVYRGVKSGFSDAVELVCAVFVDVDGFV